MKKPNFDKTKFKTYSWKSGLMLHWILNPGLAFNELILGQRVPKVSLEDITSDKPRVERTYVPCPHCDKMHDGRIWSPQNNTAFKNWFGLYCPNCGNIIPCLTNLTSLIVLILTFPIWVWFRKSLKQKWLKKQPSRYEQITIAETTNPFDKTTWWKTGLIFGFVMFLLMSVTYPLLFDLTLSPKTLMIGIFVWTLAGFAYGYFLKIYSNKKIPKKLAN